MSEHPAIDRTIYPMPMFATFQVRDIAATTAFYEAAGFVVPATIPGENGPVVVHLRRMKYQDLLLVPGEPVPGSATVSFSAGGEDLATLTSAPRRHVFPPSSWSPPWPTSTPTTNATPPPTATRIALPSYGIH